MTISELVKEYKEVFDGNPWHGESLAGTLASIPFSLVHYKPKETFHSIAELVQHLLAWRNFVLEKLNGNREYDIELNSVTDWAEKVHLKDSSEWTQLLEELRSSQTALEVSLLQKSDEWLSEETPGKNYPNQYMMLGLMHHDLYHLGQIRLIRKMAEE